MDIKNFIFKHIEKFTLGIAACYLIYTVIHTLVTLNLETHGIDAKLQSLSIVIDRKLKTGIPPPLDAERKDAAQLESRLTTPPPANLLQRPFLFSKFIHGEPNTEITTSDLLKKPEPRSSSCIEVPIRGDTEFVLKGGTADMALIQVRKLYKDTWWIESFTVEKGKIIGKKKKIGTETVDFNTCCTLIEIVPLAQKPLIMKKTAVLRNEKGDFLGTSMTDEKHMISTSKIVFEDKKGGVYNLWIGELVNLGTETVTVRP